MRRTVCTDVFLIKTVKHTFKAVYTAKLPTQPNCGKNAGEKGTDKQEKDFDDFNTLSV